MRFNFTAWDYVLKYPRILSERTKGIYAFSIYNSYIEKLIFDRLPSDIFEKGNKVILGPELSIEWIENNLEAIDLFGSESSFLVLNSEKISDNVKAYIFENLKVLDRYFILSFSGNDKFFNKLTDKDDVVGVKIDSPPFWDDNKVLNFISQEMKVPIKNDIKHYILNSVEGSAENFFFCLNMIKIHFENSLNVKLDDLKKIIQVNKFDQFDLASLLGRKIFGQFFRKLLVSNFTFDRLLTFSIFMENHLLKLSDTSSIALKKKLTKYDKQILEQSKMWKISEIQEFIAFFSKLEVSAKKKDKDYLNIIRSKLLDII